jgi:hypothetical protein
MKAGAPKEFHAVSKSVRPTGHCVNRRARCDGGTPLGRWASGKYLAAHDRTVAIRAGKLFDAGGRCSTIR